MGIRLTANAEPIPGYRLIERLGRGGYGEVWKAEAPGGMLKAIKFVYGNLDEATENGKPAEQELKALNRVKSIRHPYILSLERIDVIDGQLVIVMELADRNLFDRLRECQMQGLPGIPRDELLRYMEETAEALDLMNNQFQLQHMDIKPQNIFLVFNHIKIADFGLAKDLEGMNATLTGGVTPVYAAPETFEARVTRFCDQYSLAIVYQELLTGERPFHGTTARQLMMQHLQAAPDLAPLPPSDRPVIARALSKDPFQRFPNCAEMVRALVEAGRTAAVNPVERPGTPRAESTSVTPDAAVGVTVSQKLPPLVRKTASPSRPSVEKRPTVANLRLPTPRNEPNRPAVSEKTGPGPLRPALIIGLGQFGLLTLQRLRRAIRERFSIGSLPHLKFLYIDTEPETLQAISSSSAAVEAEEFYLARLQRPSHYQQPRNDLPPVGDWLPAPLLFRIPKQPATGGYRALGRLAFCDHYRPILDRVRQEIEACCSEAALAEASVKTGLAPQTNYPRVYIVTSLLGGTGGGMFLDLAYSTKRLLQRLGYRLPDVQGLLYLPNVAEGSAPRSGLANAHAALRELIHFSLPNTQYEALFDRNEGLLVDAEPPFRRCALLPLPRLDDSQAMRPLLGMAAGFLFQELFTSLGREADKGRGQTTRHTGALPFQTFGAFRLTWPRRTMIDRLARQCCQDILAAWESRESSHLLQPLAEWMQQQLPALDLHPGQLEMLLERAVTAKLGGELPQVVQAAFNPPGATQDAGRDDLLLLGQRLEWVLQMVGQPESGSAASRSTLNEWLDETARETAKAIRSKLSALVPMLVDQPGWRLAGAEEVCRLVGEWLRNEAALLEDDVRQRLTGVRETYLKALTLLRDLESMSRGGRYHAVARDANRYLQAYFVQRYESLRRQAVAGLLKTLASFGADESRDLRTIRERMEAVRNRIGRAKHSSQQSLFGPATTVLPPGCPDLESAVEALRTQVSPELLAELEQRLQQRLLRSHRSMFEFFLDAERDCRDTAHLLLEEACEFFESCLPQANVAEILLSNSSWDASTAGDLLREAYQLAEPTLRGSGNELVVLGVPDSEAGRRLADEAAAVLGRNDLCTVPCGAEEVLFHRELQSVQPGDLPVLGTAGHVAYQEFCDSPGITPHSRADVEWLTIHTMTTQVVISGLPPHLLPASPR